jgi:integrase/recombinase XerD
MRISEMVNLRIKDIYPYGKLVDELVLEKHATKTNQSRTVAISEQAQKHLQAWLDSRDDLEEESPLFPSQKHPRRPMRTNYAVQLMSKIFEDAGVANASSHSMRRTLINRMDQNGARVKVIQEQVGHANLSTTQKYLEVSPDEKRRAVRGLKF